MKSLFNLDNPFVQALTRVGDLMMLSIVTLVCCLPVVTIGPVLVALNKTVYALTLETCSSTLGTFFRALRDNFKQGFVLGLGLLLAITAFVCDFILLRVFFEGTAYTVMLCLVGVLTVLVLGLASYAFPLAGRYENSLSQHLRNALILMIVHLPKTLLMVFLHLTPVLMLYFRPQFLMETLVLWIFLAPGLMAQFDAFILKPVFDSLEQTEEPEEDGAEMEEDA